MKKTETNSFLPFIETYCHIHGRFGDMVYRRKCNGQPWIYDYVYKPKYSPTVLSRRVNCILKAAAGVSNPNHKGYSEISQKMYYYTPFFVYAGRYGFTCNTFLKLHAKGSYELMTGDMMLQMKLAPRTKLRMSFNEEKTYHIECYKNGILYSKREVIVIGDDVDLESAYSAWFEEHLAEILALPNPDFCAMRIYRHGIEPPIWINAIRGKTENGILYRNRRERFMYIRSAYEHDHTTQGNYFYGAMPCVTKCWSASAENFKDTWDKYHKRWFKANYRKNRKSVKTGNFWSKLVFMAGKELGFDLETLSVEHFLPGVETIGDLILTANMGGYGLTAEELSTKIFL